MLQGRSPASLLHTCSAERNAVAKELIDFDREWAAMLSDRASNDPAAVQKYFVQHGRYTAGTATHYKPALLTGAAVHQGLATGLQIGKCFHSAPVIRFGDGKQIQLGETLLADGRWRLLAFAGQRDAGAPGSPIATLCQFLSKSPESPIKRYTPAGSDVDSVFDVRAVFQQSHHQLAITTLLSCCFRLKAATGCAITKKRFAR